MDLNTTGMWRQIRKQVVITSDDPEKHIVAYTLTAYVKVGRRLDWSRVDLGEGHVGDSLQSFTINVVEDNGASKVPVSLLGESRNLKISIGEWKDGEELLRCPVQISLPKLEGSVGLHTERITIQAGESKFPVTVRYRVNPLVAVTPPTINTTQAEGAQRVELRSGPLAVHFGKLTTSFGKVRAKLLRSDDHSAEIEVSPIDGKNGYDVVQLPYTIAQNDQAETAIVPVFVR